MQGASKTSNKYAMGRGKRLEQMSNEKLQAAEYEEAHRKSSPVDDVNVRLPLLKQSWISPKNK